MQILYLILLVFIVVYYEIYKKCRSSRDIYIYIKQTLYPSSFSSVPAIFESYLNDKKLIN